LAQVTVSINGKDYALACDDGQEESIRAAGALLDASVGKLAARMSRVNDLNLVIMASVMLADDLIRMRSAPQRDLPDMEELAVALEYLAERAESVASKLAPA